MTDELADSYSPKLTPGVGPQPIEKSITMDFSKALEALKQELMVTRAGWNGNGLFVMAQFPDENSKMGVPYLYINATALGGSRAPWVPSQTDLFAEDWSVVVLDGHK